MPEGAQPEPQTLHQQLFEETEKIDRMRDDSDWHMAVCLFESAITRVFKLINSEATSGER